MTNRPRDLLRGEEGYIDLGTGGYILQMVLALGLSGVVALATWKRRFVTLVRKALGKLRGRSE